MRHALAAVLLAATASAAHAVVLYDGGQPGTPQQQGLTYIPFGPAANVTAANGTTLTTPNGTYAGFGTNNVPLDRAAGFTIRLDAQLLAETNDNDPNRAGFSLLAVTSDLRAIELGFRLDRVFAQAGNGPALFTAAETTPTFATTLPHRYDLTVLGNGYSLAADGATILSGSLRSYSDFPGLQIGPFLLDPYEVPNSIFFGNDTTSAGATLRFTYASVAAVPEPTMLAGVGALALLTRRRRA